MLEKVLFRAGVVCTGIGAYRYFVYEDDLGVSLPEVGLLGLAFYGVFKIYKVS